MVTTVHPMPNRSSLRSPTLVAERAKTAAATAATTASHTGCADQNGPVIIGSAGTNSTRLTRYCAEATRARASAPGSAASKANGRGGSAIEPTA